MKASNALLRTIIVAEGAHALPYYDVAGYRTVGVGHLIVPKDRNLEIVLGKAAPKEFRLTNNEIIQLLDLDLKVFVDGINELVSTNSVTQHMFDALVMFAFNVGIGSFKKSTLLKEINAGNIARANDQFMKWTKARIDGVLKTIQGLVNRREIERQIFTLGTSLEQLHPKYNFRISDVKAIEAAVSVYKKCR